jgi:hypothetical protein
MGSIVNSFDTARRSQNPYDAPALLARILIDFLIQAGWLADISTKFENIITNNQR